MKKFTIIISTLLLVSTTAMAQIHYAGGYQLLNNKGEVLYTGNLQMIEKANSDGSIERTYIEWTQKGVSKTICSVELSKKIGSAREVVETCPNSTSETECVGDSCVGLIQYSDFNVGKDNIVRETNTYDKRIQQVTAPIAADYLGMKKVKKYIHKLYRVEK